MATVSSAPSLQEISVNKFVSTLGKLAKQCPFSCGGALQTEDSKVVISYKKITEDWSSHPIKLPADGSESTSTVASMECLKEACSPASFGIGSETVTDKSYRDALKLDPDSFTTNFNLANTLILNQIATVMKQATSPLPITAELYKLNVYSTGGHFKTHIDTPRSKDMFGSLVVCLPSAFTGGNLVTRHQGHQVVFDWSSLSPHQIQWAGFYSDIEHEVLPVTSGHRVTLTYNLYDYTDESFVMSIGAGPELFSLPGVYQELVDALHNPHFMRAGGVLGFYCKHRYVDIDYADRFASHLKGGDAVVYRIAKSLGLKVQIKTVVLNQSNRGYRYGPNYLINGVNKFTEDDGLWECDEASIIPRVFRNGEFDDGKVTWCHEMPKSREPALATMIYGNEPSSLVFYQTAALLIEIPKYTSSRGASAASCNTEEAESGN